MLIDGYSSVNMTVDESFKVVLTGKRVVVSNALALLIICVECGNTVNVYLHNTPTNEEFAHEELQTGTTQYPAFNYCRCEQRNDIHVVK